MKEEPLVDADCVLKKFEGKGGWTYVEVPEFSPDKKTPFGWVTVKGSIDGFELKQYKLMPMGNNQLFLPVKAQIRKTIGKEVGDTVHIVLYPDHSRVSIPEEIIACLEQEDDQVYATFKAFTDSEKKAYLDWIYAAKTDETITDRIVKMMERLQHGLKFYDKHE